MDFISFLRAAFEVVVLWVVFYQLYRAFKDSRSAAILAGLVILVLAVYAIVKLMQASVLESIVSTIFGPGIILVVLFQNELRTSLAKLGSLPHLSRFSFSNSQKNFINEVCESVSYLSSKHIGALIVFCRRDKFETDDIVSVGVKVDALYTRQLIGSIFFPKTLLHDGAVIVDHERIIRASSYLPNTKRDFKDKSVGSRHRAALGLAEISDAVIVVVSEQTGSISIAVGNTMQRDLSADMLAKRLTELLYGQYTKPQKEEQGSALH